MTVGVILYGPPAAGKDSIERELTALGPYRHFARVKVGGGRTDGYRMTQPAALDALRAAGEVIWENQAYGATYVVDRGGLAEALATGVPVVHLGQPDAVVAVSGALEGVRWLVVELWCLRETAAARLETRDPADVERRLGAWDSTPRLVGADLVIDTGALGPLVAALKIAGAVGS